MSNVDTAAARTAKWLICSTSPLVDILVRVERGRLSSLATVEADSG